MKDDRDEIIDKLARRTAEENDRLARRRIREMWEPTPGQIRFSWGCFIACLILIGAIFWFVSTLR